MELSILTKRKILSIVGTLMVTFIVPVRADATSCSVAVSAASACSALSEGVAFAPSERTLCIRGMIDSGMAHQFAATVKHFGLGQGTQLVIAESPGGHIGPAMDMAELSERHGFQLVVAGLCVSSCAQFLVASRMDKTLLEGAILAFHGGPVPAAVIDAMELNLHNKQILHAENERFRAFYRERGLDLEVLHRPPADFSAVDSAGNVQMWVPELEELERAGFNKITKCEKGEES